MSAPKHAVIVCECCDSVLDDIVGIDRLGLLIGDIELVTAREPNPQHNAHPHSLAGVEPLG